MNVEDKSVNFLKNVNNLYGGNSYLEKNGMSVLITCIILIVVFSAITYSEISGHLNTIKKDWATNRCNPRYIPLAGFINTPEGESKWSYTARNFEFCINTLLGHLGQYMISPSKLMTSMAGVTTSIINVMMSKLSGFINTIRRDIIIFAQDVIARFLTLLVPIVTMWHKLSDIFKRTEGVLGFLFYFVDVMFYTIISWINLVVKVITDWVLAVFEGMGIAGVVVLLIPLIALMVSMIAAFAYILTGIIFELSAIPLELIFFPAGLAEEAIGLGIVGTGSLILSALLPVYMTVQAAAFLVTAIILIIIQFYEVSVIQPMNDLISLFPGYIERPPDKDMGDAMWWANQLNLAHDFYKPVKFEKTGKVKSKLSSGKDVLESKDKSPSGKTISGERAKQGFRNMFY